MCTWGPKRFGRLKTFLHQTLFTEVHKQSQQPVNGYSIAVLPIQIDISVVWRLCDATKYMSLSGETTTNSPFKISHELREEYAVHFCCKTWFSDVIRSNASSKTLVAWNGNNADTSRKRVLFSSSSSAFFRRPYILPFSNCHSSRNIYAGKTIRSGYYGSKDGLTLVLVQQIKQTILSNES